MDLNLRLREIRDRRRESGTAIADILDISPQYYYDIEKGDRNLSIEIAVKLANYWSVSIDYLIGRDTNEPSIDPMRLEIQELLDEIKNAPKKDIDKIIKIYRTLREK